MLLAPFCLVPGPELLGLSWGYWALLLMTFLESVLTQFFAPAEQAAIPLLVPRDCFWQPIFLSGHQHGGHDRGLRPGGADPATAEWRLSPTRPCRR